MKTIYHLTGLPRAGNTLLSSILNQNPKINTTPLSYVSGIIYTALKSCETHESSKNFKDEKSIENLISPMLYNYYKDWPGDIIIQRSNAGHWQELEINHKYIKNNFKCIVLVRDIFEVIASYLKLADEDVNFFINKNNKSISDKINFLFNYDSLINNNLKTIYTLYYGFYRHCLFIQYNDLINNPKEQVDRIYNFLEIEPFNHYYKNLSQFKVNNLEYDDSMYGKNLHKIKTDKVDKSDNSKYIRMIPEKFLKNFKYINNWLNGI